MACATPHISVIIPTYNRERHLPQCLQSVLAQTYRDFEVIVVDDGSTDSTSELMARMQEQDERIKYICKPNGGVSSARNVGIRAARGELIALLDSDDAWLPWKLEAQVAALKSLPEVGMIWTDMATINEQGMQLHDRYLRRMYGSYQKLSGPLFQKSVCLETPQAAELAQRELTVGYGEIYPQMLRGNLVHTSTVLLRKSWAMAAGLFDESYRRAGEDFGFHLRTCRLGSVALLDESTTLYRIGAEDQLTHRRFQISLAEAFLRTITDEVKAVGKDLPLTKKQLNAVLSEAHGWLGTELLSAGQRGDAFHHLLEALQRDHTNMPAWRQLVRLCLPQSIRRTLKRLLLGRSQPPAPSESTLTLDFIPQKTLAHASQVAASACAAVSEMGVHETLGL
ncbi:glycosyltransferase family 2 protein [Planctomicrobium sp. SH661]|uniref:glycosyltransferase family 2 protein n=1 Tax=Planctomicrobium sp. SH661 TaxID=3448124 RepID=UPI003F5CB177